MIPCIESSYHEPHRLVVWLRCRACGRGYFASGAPTPLPCPTCTDGRLQPIALWDLAQEAAPAGMLRRVEVYRVDLG
jgi:hypothetical protein